MDAGIIKNLKNLIKGFLPSDRISPDGTSVSQEYSPDNQFPDTYVTFPISNGSVSEGPSIQNIPVRKIQAGFKSRRGTLPTPSEADTEEHPVTLKVIRSNTTSVDDLLFEACLANNVALCRELIDTKKFKELAVDPNFKSRLGKTVLHIAAAEGYLKICEVLIEYGSGIDVNLQDSEGKTPLHIACIHNEGKIAELLVRSGAVVEIKDHQGNSPIHYAGVNRNEELVQWMIEKSSVEIGRATEPKSPPKKIIKNFAMIENMDLACSDDGSPVHLPKVMGSIEMIDGINTLIQQSSDYIRITPNEFIPIKLLGEGSFGEVYLVEKKDNHKLFAMKIIAKDKIIAEDLVRYAITERNVMSTIKHPFIVSLCYAFQTQTKLYLIEDYCSGGSLKNFLIEERKFTEERSRIYISEILLALEELHSNDIIYRDLKPENVVIDSGGHALLTDFGLSKEDVMEKDSAHSFCGSVSYLAPEMLKRTGHGKAVDWYLLGVLLYEMLTGSPPYFDLNQKKMFQKIQSGKLKIPEFVSGTARDLLTGLLEKDPDLRLGSGQGAEEIKNHEFFGGIDWEAVKNKKLSPPVPPVPIYNEILSQDVILDNTPETMPLIQGWTFISENE